MKPTVDSIRAMKPDQRKITMLTCYDTQTAHVLEEAGIDVLLVGDTLGMVFQGRETTRVVTIDQMVYHVTVVRNGAPNSLLVGDLSYGTYDTPELALPAGRRLIEAGADAVKLEGNPPGVIAALVTDGIPVMAHLGLLPQTAERFTVRGKQEEEASAIKRDAELVESAGAFALVLESVPKRLASEITAALSIPTIGIGAGNGCDGQVLVVNDMLGLTTTHVPKFVKHYASLADTIRQAAAAYAEEVRSGTFPGDEHTYH